MIIVIVLFISWHAVFGFSEPNFIGQEQGENYEVVAGYLSGRPGRGIQFMLGLNLNGQTAGNQIFWLKL